MADDDADKIPTERSNARAVDNQATVSRGAYAPTERTLRQRKFPRPIPMLAGLGSATIAARSLGLVGSAVTFGLTVTLTSMLMWWLNRRHRHRLEQRERDGRLLVVDVLFELDDSGAPRDLNHRTGSDISTGRGGDAHPYATVSGVFEATAASFHITPHASAKRRAAHEFDVQWDGVASAEVVKKRARRTMLVVLTRDGARYRFQLSSAAARVARVLAAASVAETRADAPPAIRVGDRVRVRDGREGPVVAVVAREHEPGHLEVFVQLEDTGVDSWDSSEVAILH